MAKRQKTPGSGRKKGTPNKATEGIKDLLAELFDDDEVKRRWLKFLDHKDPNVAWRAWELYNAYRFAKPPMPVVGDEALPPVHVDISSIPRKRKRSAVQSAE